MHSQDAGKDGSDRCGGQVVAQAKVGGQDFDGGSGLARFVRQVVKAVDPPGHQTEAGSSRPRCDAGGGTTLGPEY